MTQLIGITSNGKSHRNKEVFQKYNEICLEINCINQGNFIDPVNNCDLVVSMVGWWDIRVFPILVLDLARLD